MKHYAHFILIVLNLKTAQIGKCHWVVLLIATGILFIFWWKYQVNESDIIQSEKISHILKEYKKRS